MSVINSYIIIPDLHDWDKNIDNRYDYLAEVNYFKDEIINIAKSEIAKGYEPSCFFLGDICHQGFSDQAAAVRFNNYFIVLSDFFKFIKSVLGNHEQTYAKNNPFWGLMSKVTTKYAMALHAEPTGILDIIDVPDKFSDGNVHFYFNHYGTSIPMPDTNGYNILLSHNDITNKEIMALDEQSGKRLYKGHYIDLDSCSEVNNYDLVVMGHQHAKVEKVYYTPKGSDKKIEIINSGSGGRTNHTEVRNDFLERPIQIIRVKDGELYERDEYVVTLPRREECVIEEKIQLQREVRESKKELKYLTLYNPEGDDPVGNVRDKLAEENVDSIIDSIVYHTPDKEYDELLSFDIATL